MLREAKNEVLISGLVNEKNLEIDKGPRTIDGRETQEERIRGTVTVLVKNQGVDKNEDWYIPIQVYAWKTTRAGKPSKTFINLQDFHDSALSIAAVGEDQATAVRITAGQVAMNEYPRNGRLVSYPSVRANFLNMIPRDRMDYIADFSTEMFIVGKRDSENADGVVDGLILTGAIPQFGGIVTVAPFVVRSPQAVEHIGASWDVGATVFVHGRLEFKVSSEKIEKEVDFGEPIVEIRNRNISNFVIIGGRDDSQTDRAYEAEDIKKALAERQAYLDQRIEEEKNKAAQAGNVVEAASGRDDQGIFGF